AVRISVGVDVEVMRSCAPGWRKRIPSYALLASAFFVLISTGCAHTRPRVAEPAIQPLSPTEEAKLEQRVDALAHYAAGDSDELNRRQKEATDQFLQAALTDLHEEGLVLEVARRLIREQRNEEAIELLQKASIQPNPAGATFALLGLAYMQAGQTNQAVQA